MSARGLFTGNRGCIVDEREQVVRDHGSSTLWITCLTEFRDWRVLLARPNRVPSRRAQAAELRPQSQRNTYPF